MVKMIKNALKESVMFWRLYALFYKIVILCIGEKRWVNYRINKCHSYKLDIDHPQTLNEKIAWLKINYFQPFYINSSDKYLVHQYLKDKLGKDMAPHLLFVTQDPKELTYDNIKEFPCIIKTSNGSGTNLIVSSKEQYSEKQLQHIFKKFIVKSDLHTTTSREHQYDIKKPYIVVEQLLKDEKGGIPNDYKFMYINGNLEFIYCSVDRLGANVRHVYDSDWNRLHFAWVAGADETIFKRYDLSASIEKPKHFEEMKQISKKLAADFPVVRIDFYETANDIYVGEITLHHGSGHDCFYPLEYDKYYGEKLVLPAKNR